MAKEKQKRKPKTSVKVETLPVEQQEKIKALRQEIAGIKYKGSFKQSYKNLRKATIVLMKNDNLTEVQKKISLIKEIQKVISEIEETLTEEEKTSMFETVEGVE